MVLATPLRAEAIDCALVAALDAEMESLTGLPAGMPCADVGFGLFGAEGMRSQAGAYYPETGRIELAKDLDLSEAYGQSFLFHELVHAAQARAGVTACEGLLEAEAYRAQSLFQRQAGLSREAAVTGALGAMLGQCAGAEPDY